MVIFRLILLLAIYFMTIPASKKGISVEKSNVVKISKILEIVDAGSAETDEEEGELAVA